MKVRSPRSQEPFTKVADAWGSPNLQFYRLLISLQNALSSISCASLWFYLVHKEKYWHIFFREWFLSNFGNHPFFATFCLCCFCFCFFFRPTSSEGQSPSWKVSTSQLKPKRNLVPKMKIPKIFPHRKIWFSHPTLVEARVASWIFWWYGPFGFCGWSESLASKKESSRS